MPTPPAQQATLLAEAIIDSLRRGGKLVIYGNGGCASISDHIATELVGRYKHTRAPGAAISLASNPSLLTCIANDFGFERVFSRQIEALCQPEDIAIGLSTSGKSKNILEALYACQRVGCSSWLIKGSAPNNDATDLCDNIIEIDSDDTAQVQNQMLTLLHAVCSIIDEHIAAEPTASAFDKAINATADIDTLLLDRDGVINLQIANGYVTAPEALVMNADFLVHVKALAERFKNIFVVTNQRCIPKGLISIEHIDDIHNMMASEIQAAGGRIDDIFMAYSTDTHGPEYKPKTGLKDKIKQKYPNIDFKKAIMVGDSYSDYLFAKRIGAKYISC